MKYLSQITLTKCEQGGYTIEGSVKKHSWSAPITISKSVTTLSEALKYINNKLKA